MPNRNQLSFPPLVQSQQWTSKSIASWPGAEFTRRNKLRTTCIEPYNAGFLGELEEALGKETFGRFTDSLQPTTSHTTHRGRPPPEKGKKAIKAAYTLPRAKVEGESEVDLSASLASTTLSLSGRPSSSRFLETFATPYGPAPSYMFEDREKVSPCALHRTRCTWLLLVNPIYPTASRWGRYPTGSGSTGGLSRPSSIRSCTRAGCHQTSGSAGR